MNKFMCKNKNWVDVLKNPLYRKKILIVLAIIVVLGPLLFFKVLTPIFHRLGKVNKEITKNKIIIVRMKGLINEQEELEKSFDDLSRKIQAKLPSEREESQFLTEIGRVANETNVYISVMNPLPYKDLDDFKELSVEIDLEANLGNLVRFLYLMRKSSVVLVANSLKLEPKSERSALLKAHLVISTIFLKEK
ncbi:MAG: type 4a pilus biogenesis protein PilO [Candidatus Omnitrophica bacterium]|nr:type 4a pilus biogenesis protein PilO [Candidatus Omnitrophota bacterium]